MFGKRWALPIVLLVVNAFAFGQAQDGKLQIHHIDVGQGDGAVLISPKGEIVLFDMGEDMKRKDCQPAIAYLDQLETAHSIRISGSGQHSDLCGAEDVLVEEAIRSLKRA